LTFAWIIKEKFRDTLIDNIWTAQAQEDIDTKIKSIYSNDDSVYISFDSTYFNDFIKNSAHLNYKDIPNFNTIKDKMYDKSLTIMLNEKYELKDKSSEYNKMFKTIDFINKNKKNEFVSICFQYFDNTEFIYNAQVIEKVKNVNDIDKYVKISS
jgi:hypothetical protein